MPDKNLDSEGYLTYTENSSSVRQAVAQALRKIDLHSNGNETYYSDDFIYGRSGVHRTDYFRINGEHYAYTQLAVFLFTKGFLKVLIENEQEDCLIDAKIIFREYDKVSLRGKISNINGPQFQKHMDKILHDHYMEVAPLRFVEPYLNRDTLFSVKINPNEIVKLDTGYYLSGPDILFPKYYNPLIS